MFLLLPIIIVVLLLLATTGDSLRVPFLVTSHTNQRPSSLSPAALLMVIPSESKEHTSNSIRNHTTNCDCVQNDTKPSSILEDKLRYHLDRFVKMLMDEQEEKQGAAPGKSHETERNSSSPLLDWLQQNYGMDTTNELQAGTFHKLEPDEQRLRLQAFLDWFRDTFPYYYDACEHCQATGAVFQGNQPPNDVERLESSWIDTTEVYLCPACQQNTRFPRYLAAMPIVRRKSGRCSEYSLLLYRILRCLGHETRWVVDWANHVWVEVRLPLPKLPKDSQQQPQYRSDTTATTSMDITASKSNNVIEGAPRWIHLDPCEAALDLPLLYQEWGKNQTYIVAFQAPLDATQSTRNNNTTTKQQWKIVDVTQEYTSDDLEQIQARRTKEDGITSQDVAAALERANRDLQELSLLDLIEQYRTANKNATIRDC